MRLSCPIKSKSENPNARRGVCACMQESIIDIVVIDNQSTDHLPRFFFPFLGGCGLLCMQGEEESVPYQTHNNDIG